MTEDRQAYFRRRAKAARGLARSATDERVRGIHEEMAEQYEARIAELAAVEGERATGGASPPP